MIVLSSASSAAWSRAFCSICSCAAALRSSIVAFFACWSAMSCSTSALRSAAALRAASAATTFSSACFLRSAIVSRTACRRASRLRATDSASSSSWSDRDWLRAAVDETAYSSMNCSVLSAPVTMPRLETSPWPRYAWRAISAMLDRASATSVAPRSISALIAASCPRASSRRCARSSASRWVRSTSASAASSSACATGSRASMAWRSMTAWASSASVSSSSDWSSSRLPRISDWRRSAAARRSSMSSADAEATLPTRSRVVARSAAVARRRSRVISHPRVAVERDDRGDGRQEERDADEHGRDAQHVRLVDVGHPRHGLRQPVGDEVLHPYPEPAHGEQRPEHGGDRPLEEERELDEEVRRADEPHDARLAPPAQGREPDRRRDEQDRGEQHDGRETRGEQRRAVEREEQRVEDAALVLDDLDAGPPGHDVVDDLVVLGVGQLEPERRLHVVDRELRAEVAVGVALGEGLERVVLGLEVHGLDLVGELGLEHVLERGDLLGRGLPGGARRRRRALRAQEDRHLDLVVPVVLELADLGLQEHGRADEGQRHERHEDDRDGHRDVAAQALAELREDELEAHAAHSPAVAGA